MTAHRTILGSCRLEWADEDACAATAKLLALEPALRDACVELCGPLGAGKTTLVRHLLRALGVEGRVKSPSYALMESYALTGFDAWHFDFYRFEDPHEWEEAGFRDIFASPGLKLVEWPERAEGLLPPADLRLLLMPRESERSVQVDALSSRGSALARALCPESRPA